MYTMRCSVRDYSTIQIYMCTRRCLVRDLFDDTNFTCVRCDVWYATVSTLQNLHVYKTVFGTRLTRRYIFYMFTRRCLVRDYSTIQVLHVYDAMFCTRLFDDKSFACVRCAVWYATVSTFSGERYETTHSKPKNKKTKTPPHRYFRVSHLQPFRNSIRIRPIPRNNSTVGFHPFRLTQSVRHMSQAQSVQLMAV